MPFVPDEFKKKKLSLKPQLIRIIAMNYCRLYLLLLAALCTIIKAGFVPPAEWCLPSAHLKELSGCKSMVSKEEECGGKSSQEEKLNCYCTQEMLSSFYE